MDEKNKYIKARIKTQKQIEKVYPSAKYWGRPLDSEYWHPSADEVILPYLGKTVWIRKKRNDLSRFYFEIRHTDGLVVSPDWIDYFDSGDLVPCAKWADPYGERVDDIWLEPYEKRYMMIDDLLIITG
jgi:hypothetical protein